MNSHLNQNRFIKRIKGQNELLISFGKLSQDSYISALEWATTLVNITEEEKEVINKVKMSLLYVRGNP